ncbi:ABC transporter permease subunit [Acaryochloris sp. IP29b_bin.137]|uniref:PhnE/PtxC family ABC transporter permease n=1 Tax=Acaryochloris sp. IP29b_bin.137 TaxID=2969217 RepID=UPI002637429F|nr:ABC transporter permease subunit [Acaryochloris sp. IP29b_bin.137]
MTSKFILNQKSPLFGLAVLTVVGVGVGWGTTNHLWNTSGWPQFLEFWQASLHPALNSALFKTTGHAVLTTLAYAIGGTGLSLIVGFISSVFLSDVGRQALGVHAWIGQTLRIALVIPRAIHEMLWGLLLINLWGLDPLTAIAAITIPYSAIVAKVFSDILDDAPRQPLQGILHSGGQGIHSLLYGLLPAASKNLLSYSFYRFECSLRSATTLGIIGVGGLGHEIFLSLQSLRYHQVWTFIYALIALNGLVDWMSAKVRQHLDCPNRINLHLKNTTQNKQIYFSRSLLGDQALPALQSNLPTFGMVMGILIGSLVWSYTYISPDLTKLISSNTWYNIQQLVQGLRITPPSFFEYVGVSLETLSMSLLAIIAAGCGGILFSWGTASYSFLPGGLFGQNTLRQVCARAFAIVLRTVLLLCRSIPAPIWALIILFIVFPGVLPGAIALGIHNLGILGRLMAEVNENLAPHPLIALQAQGASRLTIFLYGVLPMTLPSFTAYSFYRWEVSMRETVIVGLVGAGGLGRLLSEQLSSFDSSGMLWTLSCFVVLSLSVDGISHRIREQLRST